MLSAFRQSAPTHSEFSHPFSVDETDTAINRLKSSKAPGFYGIHPEFLIHSGRLTRIWLGKFFSDILSNGHLPPEFKEAKVISLLKPGKPQDRVDSYCPIALLSSSYKLLEKLIVIRIGSKIDTFLPMEQAGFRHNRSCVDQVLSLTGHIEAGFQ